MYYLINTEASLSLTPESENEGTRAGRTPPSIRGVTAEMSPDALPGREGGFRAQGPVGCKSLCSHFEPIQGWWFVKHVSLLLYCTSVSLNESS